MHSHRFVQFIASFVFSFNVLPSYAALIDRGGGLIYDDVLNVTWLQDASYVATTGYDEYGKLSWTDAMVWADNLEYYDPLRNITWDNWRLPSTINSPNSIGYDITGVSSELAYMYYVNLGFMPDYDPDPINDPPPSSSNYNPFKNLQARGYWSGTLSDLSNRAWYLHFHFGFQDINDIYDEQRVWAVMDGDVSLSTMLVPIPAAFWLFTSGLLCLIRIARYA